MAIDIHINTQSGRVINAVVNGLKRPTQAVTPPSFVTGSTTAVNLYLVRDDGTYDARSGANATNVAVTIGAESADAEGTYTITDGTNTTAAIATAAQDETIEAICNQTGGGVGLGGDKLDVVKEGKRAWRCTFRSNGAQSALAGTSIDLHPASSVSASILVGGDANTRAQQLVEIKTTPAVNETNWTANASANVFTGNITPPAITAFAGTALTMTIKVGDEKVCAVPVRVLPSVSS